MDKNRINKILDKAINLSSDSLKEYELHYERKLAKDEDENAFIEAGIARLTLFCVGGGRGLLVKPNNLIPTHSINLFSGGVLNIDPIDDDTFKVSSISGEVFRFHISGLGFSYWVDLIDEKQAQDLAKFLDITITPHYELTGISD